MAAPKEITGRKSAFHLFIWEAGGRKDPIHSIVLGESKMTDNAIELLKMADLEIIEYNIQRLNSMSNRNRVFPFYVMSYLQDGEACLLVDGQVYHTGPGSIILVPPNTKHDHYKVDTGETTFLWWHFKFSVASVVDAIKVLRFPLVSYLSHKEQFEQTFYRFYSSAQFNSLSSLLMHRACGLELMALLIEELVSDHNVHLGPDIPEAFLQIFYETTDLKLPDLSLKYFSEKYHMNSNYISSQFKKYFGMTPMYLRRELIFERSKKMLQTTGMSVSEIAYDLGFDSLYSFTHFFTARAGTSPSAFRGSGKPGNG